MNVPPIRLLRPSGMTIDANEPCVLEIAIPVGLPHRLDPSMPALPYHPDTIRAELFRDWHAIPLLRRLMPQIVSNFFGPEHTRSALKTPNVATTPPCDIRLMANWDLSIIEDKETNLDIAAGRWKDIYGDEGHGPIDAYDEDPWGRVRILHAFKLSLIRGVWDAEQLEKMNPRVLNHPY
ncbi:hypothetical protein N658DRAFT_498805 [Parathielavia hyrcaniae]|uniref:Uncharacterized protein n=1 Tax=Parathielavia hyrcaniae TaxID=113614 RepID=A0AAN6SZB2_9PEZI|nr:hypothetical protein N658DRAFT_498805 [Parathielavia hyrcaniae]